MKKIITVVAALCFVMSGFAEAITCAEAVALTKALEDGATSTEEYTVHGFITYTDGVVSSKNGSPNQQVFWMADEAGEDKVFQAYWANLPEPYQTNAEPLLVGTELNMTGKLMKYVKNDVVTPEMKNGTIEIISVPSIERDTFDVTADEAVLEASAWSVGEISSDLYRVSGKVLEVTEAYEPNTGVPGFNGRSTFLLEVTNEDSIVFKAFRCYSVEEVFAGDSVVILGPLQLYAEKVVEISGGKVTITKKDHEEAQVFQVTADEAIEEALNHEVKWLSPDVYIVSGVVDSISYAYNAENGTQSFYLASTNETAKFCAYSCKVPREIVVGDEVYVKGHLQLFAADLAEIKGGDVLFNLDAVENVSDNNDKSVKVLRNGQLVIIRNGVRYNAVGAIVK